MRSRLTETLWRKVHSLSLQVSSGQFGAAILRELKKDQDFVEGLRSRPQPEVVETFIDVSHRIHEHNTFGLRAEIVETVGMVDQTVVGMAADAFALEHISHILLHLYDDLRIATNYISVGISDKVKVHDERYLQEAIARKRGILLYSVYQSSPCFARAVNGLTAYSIGLVRNQRHGESAVFANAHWNFEEISASPAGARRLLSVLRSRGAVALYGDYAYPNSSRLKSPLFGRAVLISKAMVRIVLSTKAPVVPVCVARETSDFDSPISIRFFPAVEFPTLTTKSDSDVALAATYFGVVTECLVRRYPAQWRLWTSLSHRWSEACVN